MIKHEIFANNISSYFVIRNYGCMYLLVHIWWFLMKYLIWHIQLISSWYVIVKRKGILSYIILCDWWSDWAIMKKCFGSCCYSDMNMKGKERERDWECYLYLDQISNLLLFCQNFKKVASGWNKATVRLQLA